MAPPLFPDEPLPPRTIGLLEFIQLAEHYSEDENIRDFVNLVLAGRVPGNHLNADGTPQQDRLFINPRYGVDFPDHYTILGDFDSVIGLTRHLPFIKAITWHLFPPFSQTLTTDIHLRWPIPGNNQVRYVPLHKIPNFMCMKFGTRHQGRLFFPKQYDPHRSPKLEEEFLARVYDDAILPTMKEVTPELTVHWPVTYAHVKSLVRGGDGRLGTLSKDIPPMFLKQFAAVLLVKLNQLGDGFADAFFEIEVKGVKSSSVHNPENPFGRGDALAAVLSPIDKNLIPEDELETCWFVDVALEIHAEGRVMQWLADSHPRLIHHILPSITAEQAQALHRSNAFKEDISGHLTALAGFRLEPGAKGHADHVSYINVYTTDKSATYQQHRGAYCRRTGQDLLPKPFEKFIRDVDLVTTTFAECAGFPSGVLQNGAARMEARLVMEYAENALTDISDELVMESVLAVPSAIWWYFKFYRASALYRLFKELSDSPPDTRAWIPSLMLGAVAIYMFNAIIYRPSGKRIEGQLATLCAFWTHPHVHPYEDGYADADFEDVNLVPCTRDRGLYFLSGFVIDGTHNVFRLSAVRQLDRDELAILYQKPSLCEIQKAFGGRSFGLSLLSRAHKDRTNNRRTTVPVQAIRGQLTLHDFALTQRGMARVPSMQMTGPDIENATASDEEDQESLDRVFSKIWAQFPSDIVQSSPNFKNRHQPSYIKLSMAQREDVTGDLFKSPELPFDSTYIRLCTEDQWRQFVFDKFFPPKGTVLSDRLQNFRQSLYFSSYLQEINALSDHDAAAVCEEIWQLVRSFVWLPHPASDRMWQSKSRELTKGWSVLPSTHVGPAVHIAVNACKCSDPSILTVRSMPVPLPPPQTVIADDEDAAWVELARRLAVINNAMQEDPDPTLGAAHHVGHLLQSLRRTSRNSASHPPNRRSRSLSAGSSASQAGRRSRRAHSADRREEEESSGVEVARGLQEKPVDVFSIGLTHYINLGSPGHHSPSPFRFSSPDIVESALFQGLDDMDIGESDSQFNHLSSPTTEPASKRRRIE